MLSGPRDICYRVCSSGAKETLPASKQKGAPFMTRLRFMSGAPLLSS